VELKQSATGARDRLVFFAVPEEAGPFRKAWVQNGGSPWRKEAHESGVTTWYSSEVRIVVTGMGPRNSRRVASALLAERPVEWVVTAGFAGGLDPKLDGGTVGYCADPKFPKRHLLECAGARPLRFLEVDRVAVTPEAKRVLRGQSRADAVEMESATIRTLCHQQGIPSATERVISDTATERLPLDFGALMTSDDRIDFGRLAWELVRSPGKVPELIRFQRRVARASAELARVLVALFPR
jgi:adenosylhomocysteine nucleosidase